MNRAAALLAAAVAAAIPAAASPAPPRTRVQITLESHRYSPAPIYLAGGVPVRLIFVNRAGKDHDFTAPQFFQTSRLLAGRVVRGEVAVPPGKTRIVDLVPTRGTYKVHCGEFGHRLLGMSTMIIVN
jgi:plastocyanin